LSYSLPKLTTQVDDFKKCPVFRGRIFKKKMNQKFFIPTMDQHHVVQSLVLSSAAACLFVFWGKGSIAAFLPKSTEKEITTTIN